MKVRTRAERERQQLPRLFQKAGKIKCDELGKKERNLRKSDGRVVINSITANENVTHPETLLAIVKGTGT